MHEMPLPESTWLGWFGAEEVAEALACANGDGHEVSSMGGTSAQYAYGRRMPRCQVCKTDVPSTEFEAAAQRGHHICSCGEKLRVREANDLAKVMVPGAKFLIGEGATGNSGTEGKAASEPVMFSCMACAGSLTVDGSSRTIACGYCGGSNYLPDGLWLRLHPPRTVVTFFVVLELDGEAEGPGPELLARLAVSEDYDVRAAAARNPMLEPGLFATLAADDDSDVRRALAANPNLPAPIAEQLALDDDYQVRVAVVRHLTSARLAELAAHEEDSDVLKAIGKRRDLDEAVLKALATCSHYSGRVQAARHENSSDTVLRLLADESDSDVVRALKQRTKSAALLQAFAASESYDLREMVAADPNTPDAVLVMLSADTDSDVLKALVKREGELPRAAVMALARNYNVGELAQARPEYSAGVWARRKMWLAVLVVVVLIVVCIGAATGTLGVMAMVGRRLMRMMG